MYITSDGIQLRLSAKGSELGVTKNAFAHMQTGGSGSDIFYSASGETDTGGAGDDSYYIWNTNNKIVENPGSGVDTVFGTFWGVYTLPVNVENLVLSGGGASWDYGNSLDNIMIAGAASAFLDGGPGNDVLVGGAGRDIFNIEKGNGSDAIENFDVSIDQVRLQNEGVTTYAALTGMMKQVGADVVVALPDGETVTIRNTGLPTLSATDFVFANTSASGSVTSLLQSTTSPSAGALSHLSDANSLVAKNGWFAFDNAWGAGSLVQGKEYTISGTYHAADLANGTTFGWSFPTVATALYMPPTVRAYPEILFGNSPKSGSTVDVGDSAHVFPVQVDAIKGLTATHDLSFSGDTRGFDVAYDMFLTKTTTGGVSSISNEVMIWVHQGDFPAFGDYVGTYQDGSFSANVYYSAAQHYTAVVASTDTPDATIDIAKILTYLETKGIVSGTEYLRGVELGAEVVSGTGSLAINNLSLNVTTSDGQGGTIDKLVTGSGTTVTTTPAVATSPSQPGPGTIGAGSAGSDSVAAAAQAAITKATAAGTTTLLDANGISIGTATSTIDASGKTIVTKTDAAGESIGRDVITHDATTMTTMHYSSAGAFTGYGKVTYSSDGSVSTQHYDATWQLVGTDKSTKASDGTVTVQHFNGAYALTATDKISISGNTTTTQHYDAGFNLTGTDKLIHSADGSTAIQHYDAKYALTSADLIKVANSTTTTYHYDGAYKLLGVDVATENSDGTTKTLNYDGNYKLVSTTLTGTGGADTLTGSSGTTHFYGGIGGDTLIGGSGVDYFHFNSSLAQGDVDTIRNFTATQDKIVLDHTVFGALGTAGALNAAMFVSGTKATTASQHVIYDSSTGNLYYDADGSGSQAPVLLAHVGADHALTAGNFIVN